MQYAKSIVAIAGSAVTAALGILPAHTTVWTLLTILSAALTAAGVYLVPNGSAAANPVAAPVVPKP